MASNGMIMVINQGVQAAENMKELIEFMDAPDVRTATPGDWRQQVADGRLDAVFLGTDLSEREIRTVVGDVAKVDPNIPIVVLHEEEDSAC